jgi:hypothetical protein
MKKNLIGIIAIAALGGLVASGCTYSKGKIPVVDVSGGIGGQEDMEGQQEAGSKSTESIVEGEGEAIAPPSGQAPADLPSDVAAGGEEEAEDDASPLAVEAVDGTNYRTIYVIFNKPVDAASIVQNDSIQFYGTSDGLMSLKIQGELTAGVNPNVIKFTAKEDFIVSLVYTVKILGADSQDPAKAATDAAQNKLEKEYLRKLMCVGKTPSGMGTDGLLICQASTKTTKPLAVKSTELLSDRRTIIVTFTKPVDVQAAIQNQSIVINDLSHLFPKTLKGTLFSGLLSSNVSFSEVVAFTLDKSEKELHVDTNLNIVPYQIEVYGLDSDVSSKAVKDQSGTAMTHEYQHMFICGNDSNTDQTTYVQGCPAISTP